MRISRTVEIQKKVGRNDPCPCGSGKKYKKCCLRKTQSEPFFAPNEPGWLQALTDWATIQSWYSPNWERAFHSVFGNEKKEVNEEELHALGELLHFDIKVKGGKTPLELFTEEADLTEGKREVYKSWMRNSIFGCWEVKEIYLGKGLKIARWPQGAEYFISERMGTYSMQPGNILVARILPFKGGFMFAGGLIARLPQAWEYELKKNKTPISISPLEFAKLWFGKSFKKPEIPLAYEEAKKEFFDLVIREELPFDLPNFDKRLSKAKYITVFFYPAMQSVYGNQALMEKLGNLTTLLWRLTKKPDSIDEQAGPMEKALSLDFMKYCAKKFTEEQIADQVAQLTLCRNLRKKWLITPQKELDNLTPEEVILQEREGIGDTRETIEFESTSILWLKRWDDATKLHELGLRAFRKENFPKAFEHFNSIQAKYPDFPYLFRSIGNLAMAQIALGDKSAGIRLLDEALRLNPNYKFAKERKLAISKIPAERIKELSKAKILEKASGKILTMIKKTKARKRGYWFPKKPNKI